MAHLNSKPFGIDKGDIFEITADKPDSDFAVIYEYYDKLNQFSRLKDVLEVGKVYHIPLSPSLSMDRDGKLSRGGSMWIILNGELLYVRTSGFKIVNIKEARDKKIDRIINEN